MIANEPYYLSKGSHSTAADGRCAMEWVSYLAGEPHSDQPICVSPVLRSFCINLNDVMDDQTRQKLRPYLARTIGTAGDGLEGHRGGLCLDWLVRVHAPAWLDLVPSLKGHAEALRNIPEKLVVENTAYALDLIRPAQKAAAAAWDAVRAAARDAARDAAQAAARDAARDAAWATARAAARDAAWDAAQAAAWDAARDAAWDAARDAAWDAVRDAAGAALNPTVEILQASALDLLDRMLPGKIIVMPAVEDWRQICEPDTVASGSASTCTM